MNYFANLHFFAEKNKKAWRFREKLFFVSGNSIFFRIFAV